MVDRSYLLEQPGPPSALKRYFDQTTIPAAIDAFGLLESLANTVANAARRAPVTALTLALCGGIALAATTGPARKQG